MEIQQRTVDPGITVIAIEGKITLGSEGMAVKKAIDELLGGGRNKLVLDMARVSYVDSAGLGIIVSSSSKISESGGELRLAAAPDNVKEVLPVSNVLRLVTLHETVDEAVEGMRGQHG